MTELTGLPTNTLIDHPTASAASLPAVIAAQSDSPSKKQDIFPWVITIFIEGIIFFLLLFLLPSSFWIQGKQFIVRYIFQSAYLSVENQQNLSQAVIKSVRLKKPGFLAITLPNEFDSPGDNTIGGIPIPLAAGEYKDMPIQIADKSFFQLPQLRKDPWNKLFVIMYYDDGDGEFDRNTDIVAKDALGNPVIALFTLF